MVEVAPSRIDTKEDSKPKKIQIPYDSNKKHPLKHEWTLLYDSEGNKNKSKQVTANEYGTTIKEVLTVSTVNLFFFFSFCAPKKWRSRYLFFFFSCCKKSPKFKINKPIVFERFLC